MLFPSTQCEQSIPAKLRDKPSETHERHAQMDTVRNLRDMGGYSTVDGREVAWGKIYRSAGLHEATEEDLKFLLNSLGIKQVLDLRNQGEMKDDPEPDLIVDNHLVRYQAIDILVKGTSRPDIVAMLKHDHPEQQDFVEFLKMVNRKMVTEHDDDMKAFFHTLLVADGPFLFHCTEGKDRTGFAAAILLSALGVGKECIFEDYLLTNKLNARVIKERIQLAYSLSMFKVSKDQLSELLTVNSSYLQAGFDEIERCYGSVEEYLGKALELDESKLQRLKEKFLVNTES